MCVCVLSENVFVSFFTLLFLMFISFPIFLPATLCSKYSLLMQMFFSADSVDRSVFSKKYSHMVANFTYGGK